VKRKLFFEGCHPDTLAKLEIPCVYPLFAKQEEGQEKVKLAHTNIKEAWHHIGLRLLYVLLTATPFHRSDTTLSNYFSLVSFSRMFPIS
jgi:hypothetical protein